jgi:cathepsin A (carboxypeptidase C)
VRAEGDWRSKPLIFWHNGGPICSSIYGLFIENGPVLMNEQGRLEANPFSWHRKASVLYMDYPAS